jgi:hypothetical protein
METDTTHVFNLEECLYNADNLEKVWPGTKAIMEKVIKFIITFVKHIIFQYYPN